MARPSPAEEGPTRKVKVSVTLDGEPIDELRQRVGARGLSAVINHAVHEEAGRLRREDALDAWLRELEAEDGPIPRQLIDKWEQIWDEVEERKK